MGSDAVLEMPSVAVGGRLRLLLGILAAAVVAPSLGVVVWVGASGGSWNLDLAILLLQMLLLQAGAVLIGGAAGAALSTGIHVVAPGVSSRSIDDVRFWLILVIGLCAAVAATVWSIAGLAVPIG